MSKATVESWTVNDLLAYRHPDAGKIVINKRRGVCTLKFDCPYEIDLDRIKTEGDLLAWVRHLAGKPWMNGGRLKLFIDAVGVYKGIKVRL